MNIDKLVTILIDNTYQKLKKNTEIIDAELKKLNIRQQDRLDWINKILKIAKITTHQKTRESYIRSYFRIFQKGIDTDGRGGSIIIEITKKCNKSCKHCYSKFSGKNLEMPDELLNRIIQYATNHFKHIFITGGEPTLDPRVLRIAENNPDVVFFIFTNGSTINDSYSKQLASLGNLIPIIGIDGSTESSHDSLRGDGSYQEVMHAISSLNKYNLSWGCISLVTEQNAGDVLSDDYVKDKIKKGAFLLRYLEYIPVGPHPLLDLILSGETYYFLEKRKKEIIESGVIYMQETTQKKCNGLLFFTVDGYIKNCFSFHYSKYYVSVGNMTTAIANVRKEWTSFDWQGECPLYSDPHGFKNHLKKLGWKQQSTVAEPYLNDSKIAAHLMHSYKTFLKMSSEKAL